MKSNKSNTSKTLLNYIEEQYIQDKKIAQQQALQNKEGTTVDYQVMLSDYTAPSFGGSETIRFVLQEINNNTRKALYLVKNHPLFDCRNNAMKCIDCIWS